ncbi:DUF2125 domain-containing protein [Roseovarius sp. CAU 1744]|uniref:DUF2125 domain-containing protein n=1 Tax=Roseovarius sp. CAU 1744 TaxID=3140368 RepID=UPI00325A5A48
MTGSAAFADVTAEQVWNDWKQYMAGFGYDMQAEEDYSAGALTVSNLTMAMQIPEEDVSISIAMGGFTFTDNGDGTVSMSIPPQMPITVNVDAAEGEDVDVKVDYDTSGYSVVISGDPDDMTYNYSVAEITIALAEMAVNGAPVDFGQASVTMTDITGSSNMKKGDMRSTVQRVNSGPITFLADINDPEGPGQMKVSGGYDSIGFTGEGSFPLVMDPAQMSEMLEAGFAFNGAFSFGAGSSEFNFTDEEQAVQGASSTGGGTLDVAMDADRLSYAGRAVDYEIQLSGGEFPFPVEMAMRETAFNLLMPVASSDEEQDFAFGLTMGDFTMSDLIWSMFDAGGQLPRDPATIAIDLTGKVKLLVDLMNPDEMAAVDRGEKMPGELHALDLNNLRVSVAGAELTGEGGFTFDNSDMVTFGGMPAPTGSVDLKLVGGNGLLDKLVAMGFVPEEQAMGARMMMGMFAVPGQGEDELTSKIEVTGDGQVKANGQRLK